MRNYQNSDYAANKYSDGIVYRFANQTIEITLADYLNDNPTKTEKDFRELKGISDEIYLDQARKENAQTKRNVSLESAERLPHSTQQSMELDYIEKSDRQYSRKALAQLLESGTLTEVQKRRLTLYIFKELSLRQIADLEQVHFTSVEESINAAIQKLKKFFEKI